MRRGSLKGLVMIHIRGRIEEYIRRQRDILIGLSADFTGILAGFASSLLIPYLGRVEWILFVIPLLLTVRGAVNGAFSGRLTTGLNIGTIYPRLRGNTEEFGVLVTVMLLVGVLNSTLAAIIIGIYSANFVKFIVALVVLVDLFFVAACFSVVITSLVGFFAYKRNIDPDAVVYPIMSTVNDIFGSLLLLLIIVLLEPWDTLSAFVRGLPILLISVLTVLHMLRRYHRSEMFKRTVAEIYPAIIFSLILSSFAGFLLSLLEKRIISHPGILVALPAMMDTIGDVGAIVASSITTRLHIGTIELKFRSILTVFLQLPDYMIPLALLASSYALFGAILSGMIADFPYLLTMYLAVSLIGMMVILPLSLSIATITFKYGLNPDNLSIPILTAITDLLTVIMVYMLA